MDRQKNTLDRILVVNSLHSFTLAIICALNFLSSSWNLEIQGHPRVLQLLNNLKEFFFFLSSPICCPVFVSQSEAEQRQTQKTKHICLTNPFLPTYEVIPLHAVSKRKIYPNWGHEKLSLIECHSSHTQNEVMWWDPVRKRFVMISLSIYNAHRTVVLSGPIGAAVVMNHSSNMGLWKKLLFPHLYDVIRMNSTHI